LFNAQLSLIAAQAREEGADGYVADHVEVMREVVAELDRNAEAAEAAAQGDTIGASTLSKSAEYRAWQQKRRRTELQDLIHD